jgi:hypothetical protein
MSNLKKKRNDRPIEAYRPLMIAALVAGGVLQPLLRPVLAAGVAAGTTISNTATATYTDDNANPFAATSNTVQIKVAPISGLTVKPTGITDVNAGAVEKGDTLQYNFDVKNVGNLTEDIYIPLAPATKNFTLSPTTPVLVNIGTVALPNFVNPASDVAKFTPVVVGGVTVGYKVLNVAPDQTVQVRVLGTVPITGITAGDPITVTLGNTGANDNSALTQNIVDGTDGANNDEVRTVSTLDPNGVNGPVDNKEASGSQFIPFATSSTPQAFSLLKKTIASVSPGATANGNDDTINYNLNFSVLNTSPNGSLTPADLTGTAIKLEGVSATKVLVSDAIPVGTVLTGAPTSVPAGWQAVYSTDSVASTVPVGPLTQATLAPANWTATAPTTAAGFSAVKRIGFIATTPTVAKGTSVDFKISVLTSNLPVNGGKVDNIAQAFGQTFGDPSLTPQVVYEESGDSNPNNFDDLGNPGPAFDPAKDTGKADPILQGIDTKGDSTGTGIKGEVTEITISGVGSPAADSIFNGPKLTPDAVGPTDVNDDFTNQSTTVPAGQDPNAFIPAALTSKFTNSIKNPTQVTLSEVTIQPIGPLSAEIADGIAATGQYGANADIPNGTSVKITATTIATGQVPATVRTATYTYSGGVFTLASSTTGGTIDINGVLTGATADTTAKAVNVGGLAPNTSVNYTVDVTLPGGLVKPVTAVAIPIIAFPDDSPTLTPGYSGELTNNITLDRVYTGYVKLIKEARILASDKVTEIETWTGSPLKTVNSGQYVEYRIKYQNISTPAATGSGNVVLNANNFKLVEDGAAVGFSNNTVANPTANTWYANTLHQKNTFASNGTVTYFNGTGTSSPIGNTDPADGSDVGRYENQLTLPLAPTDNGSFQFRRVVK